MTATGAQRLSQAPIFARNILFFILGRFVPLLIAVVTMPFIVKGLGVERFGVLTLVWSTIGYFNLLEWGIGRATTKFIAQAFGNNQIQDVRKYLWTSFTLQSALGVVYAGILALATPLLVEHILKISPELIPEAKMGFYTAALVIPVTLMSVTCQAALEAKQRFDITNTIQILSTSATFITPLIVIWAGFGLPVIIAQLFVVRVITVVAYLMFCLRVLPLSSGQGTFSWNSAKLLLRYGWWVAVSNMIMAVLFYLDKFLIAALLSVGILAYYTIPLEVTTRLLFIPGSIAAVLFPVFCMLTESDNNITGRLYARALKFTLLSTGPIVLVILLLGFHILRLWLGQDFAFNSAVILKILIFSMVFNAVATLTLNLYDGIGRPDVRGKVAVVYSIVYLGVVSVLILKIGIVGAALGWFLRCALELILSFWIGGKISGVNFSWAADKSIRKAMQIWVSFVAMALIVGSVVSQVGIYVWINCIITVTTVSVFMWVAWHYAMDNQDKNVIEDFLSFLFSPKLWKATLAKRGSIIH